jgi:hypothetical protein
MNSTQLHTPIVFIIFNRPESTRIADAMVGRNMFTVSLPIKILNKIRAVLKNMWSNR